MSITNLQQNIHNRQLVIYNSNMSNFNAVEFADWLNKAYESSSFKSFSALASAAKLQRSTVSALANAKPQTLTAKASQPKVDTVIALAKALNDDVDKVLHVAGYAPTKSAETYQILEGVMISFQDKKFTKKDQEEIARIVRMVAIGKEAENQNE